MALRRPSVIKPTGRSVELYGSDGGRPAFIAQDTIGPKLLQSLNVLREDVNELTRHASTVDGEVVFEDLRGTSGDTLALVHGLGRRVRWSVVDWLPDTPGDAPVLWRDASSTEDRLVLGVGQAGLYTVRVW